MSYFLIFKNEFHSLKYLRSTTLQVTKIKGLKNQSLTNYTNVGKKYLDKYIIMFYA